MSSPSPSPAASPVAPVASASCTFQLGFGQLRERIGADTVGDCLEDEAVLDTGDTSQPTTRGELLWRKNDSRTAFTNGSHTWIEGPNGIQKRPNGERFAWEPDARRAAQAAPTPFALPPALPGSILPAHRVVSYYGNQLSSRMGILGELPVPEMLARLKQQSEAYAVADRSRPIRPALELIAIVAQEGAGRDGLYRLRMDEEVIEEVAQWAESNNFLLILDVQVGRSKVAPEVRSLLPFLKRPYVHLALDPEFAMAPDEKPGEEIGTHDAADVNEAIDILSEVVASENLPPKMLLVHRFTYPMLTNYQRIKSDPRVQVAIIMDGFGTPEAKISKYEALVRNERVAYGGFKLFYKQDKPVMTPAEVLGLDPTPDVVIYQ